MCEHTPSCPPGMDCPPMKWCQPEACPVECAWDHEVMCYDDMRGTESCFPMASGCPLSCMPEEVKCHSPPMCEGCPPSSWCSPPGMPCPVVCSMNETFCHDPRTMTDSCHPSSTGCPVNCMPQENLCVQNSPCPLGVDGEVITCPPMQWCQMDACPLQCGVGEMSCHDPGTMTESCHPFAAGCPVNCPAGDSICHSPAPHPGDMAYNWCSPADMPCPITCGMDEIICWNEKDNTESCHPLAMGCPVHCAPDENVCREQPMCNGCAGYNWCSRDPCPIMCQPNEMLCNVCDNDHGDHLDNEMSMTDKKRLG